MNGHSVESQTFAGSPVFQGRPRGALREIGLAMIDAAAGRVKDIRKVAVLGAGTMGSRIAAHLANAGLPVVLLDIVPAGMAADAPKAERNKFVLASLDGLKKSKPTAFYSGDAARLLTLGNFEDDLALGRGLRLDYRGRGGEPGDQTDAAAEGAGASASGVDLHVEHVGFADREDCRGGCRTTCGGIGLGRIFSIRHGTCVCSRLFRRRSRTAKTWRRSRIFAISGWARLWVRSHDTPNFIANRIGTFSMGNAIRLMMEQGLTIEEVDALTGAPLGWPKTGTFRLGDLVGVDVLAHVASNFSKQAGAIGDERQDVELAPVYLDDAGAEVAWR